MSAVPLSALSACSSRSGEQSPAPTSPASGDELHQLLAAVRRSPDHLKSRAAAVVSTKDARKIARFVRDAIAVLPPPDPRSAPETYSLWGARGTLRGGAGVLRDRAELLAELLGEAGFRAQVVAIARPAALDEAALYAPVEHEFQPDAAALRPIFERLQVTAPASSEDPETERAVGELARRIREALPSDAASASADAAPLPATVPIVEFVDDGTAAWAVALGEDDIVTERPPGTSAALDAAVSEKVTVSVAVALKPPIGSDVDPTALTTVLEGSFAASDLVGRQLVLGFPPPGEPKDLVGQDFSAAPARIPVLRLMAPDAAPEDAFQVIAGKPLLEAGAVLDVPAGDTPVEGPLGALVSLDDSARVAAVARIDSIDASVSASAFPTVELDLSVRDAAGKLVNGLRAEDFVVAEEDSPQRVSVVSNSARDTTRVLIMYDMSGSVTDAWASPAERVAFEAELAGAVASASDETPFEVQVVGLGGTPSRDAWELPDADALASTLAGVGASTSDVWQTLGDILPASGASAAILVSDAASSLEDPARVEQWKRAVASNGIPIAVVPLGAVDEAATDEIVEDSGGVRLDATSDTLADDLATFLTAHAASAALTNYRLRYRAPTDGPVKRHVAVKLAARQEFGASLSYSVPPAGERAQPSGVAGLYVTLTVGSVRSQRRLAGAQVSWRGSVIVPFADDAVDETRAALAGMHTLLFEPTAPTLAHLFDDALSGLISAEEFATQAKAGTDAVVAALPGIKLFPLVAPLLLEAPADVAGRPFATALRVFVLGSRFDGKTLERTVDVVPEFNVWTTTGDAESRFAAALERSLYASAREGQTLAESAFAELGSRKLFAVGSGGKPPADWDAETVARFGPVLDQYSSWLRLVPEDGKVGALWVVDPATGSATAVSLDGRGGGADAACAPDADLLQLINLGLLVLSFACTIASPPSGVAKFACVGANVFGVGVLAYGSYTSGVNFNFAVGAVGAVWSFAPTKGGWSPEAVASRAVTAVLQAMLGVVGLGTYC